MVFYSKAYNYLDALKRRGYNPRQRRWGRCSLTNCPHIFGLYYNEDTIKGDTLNDLWGDNHGTLINAPELVEGIYGQALEFTGENHVDIPDSESLDIETGEVSVTAWALRTGPGQTERGGIVEKGNGGMWAEIKALRR